MSIPPLSGPSRVFVFAHESTEQVRDYTRSSSFVLFDDGAFVLKYPSGEYHGAYTVANDIVTFEWEGWSLAGPWGATGTLDGDTLTVQYNTVMDLSDFENAAYVLAATNQNP